MCREENGSGFVAIKEGRLRGSVRKPARAVTKFAAALLTGSSSMLSEGVHSLVDSGNEALLLYGYYRSSLPPDHARPLGYGRELYFWSFVVALLLFALGGLFDLRRHHADYRADPHRQCPRQLHRSRAVFSIRGRLMVGSARHVSRIQGPRGLLGSDPEKQGPPVFHCTAGRQRGSNWHFDRRGRYLPFGSVATPRTRWLRLDSYRYAAGCNRMASGPREQGASDRRTRARLHQRIDPRARRE
jgi:hypothetical protein